MRQDRLTRVQWGVLALVVIGVFTYFGFAKNNPFTHPFELKAMFANAATSSPTRRSGSRASRSARSRRSRPPPTTRRPPRSPWRSRTRAADPRGRRAQDPAAHLPRGQLLHRPQAGHAECARRRRRRHPDDQHQRSGAVDQVLSTLQSDARKDLQKVIQAYGSAIGGDPEPGEDADQVRATRGETAGESLNDTLEHSPEALRGLTSSLRPTRKSRSRCRRAPWPSRCRSSLLPPAASAPPPPPAAAVRRTAGEGRRHHRRPLLVLSSADGQGQAIRKMDRAANDRARRFAGGQGAVSSRWQAVVSRGPERPEARRRNGPRPAAGGAFGKASRSHPKFASRRKKRCSPRPTSGVRCFLRWPAPR